MQDPYRQYRQTAIHTASPEQLVIMLYDGALRFLEEGRQQMVQMEDGDAALTRVQDIIAELMVCLNYEAGEIATNLGRLYEFFLYQLAVARVRRDAEMLAQVAGMMREMREAFSGAAQQVRCERDQAAASAANAAGLRG